MALTFDKAELIQAIINEASSIVILQADNPDADSLGSALALEHILGDLDKQPHLYCGIDVPSYLHYLTGWDRVVTELPKRFDVSLIVDDSSLSLLGKLISSPQYSALATKPSIVLDHHAEVSDPISFATTLINEPKASSTGELIYWLAKQLGWPLSVAAQELLMSAILGDTQGLTNRLTTLETYKAMTAMVEAGVDRPKLEDQRREYIKMPLEILRYKARLIDKAQITDDGQIATVVIPQTEINEFSPLYNPAPLIQGDLLQTTGIKVAIVFKYYDDGHLTASIRTNNSAGVAGKLAEHYGGGGHKYASGFKLTNINSVDDIVRKTIKLAKELIADEENTDHETI